MPICMRRGLITQKKNALKKNKGNKPKIYKYCFILNQ